MFYHCFGSIIFRDLETVDRSEVCIQYESKQHKKALDSTTRAFLCCFEIKYKFYQCTFGRKKNTGQTNSCILKIT